MRPRWVMPVLVVSTVMMVAALGIMLYAQWQQATLRERSEREALPALSAQDDLRYSQLKRAVLPLAHKLLSADKTFVAFAAGANRTGDVTLITGDDSVLGKEAVLEALHRQLTQAIGQGRFLAVATCAPVSETDANAIEIHLECKRDARLGVIEVKRSASGEVSFGATTVSKVEPRCRQRR